MKECPHCSEVLPDEVKWCRFCKKNTEMKPKFGEKAKRLEALRNEIKGKESYIKSLEKEAWHLRVAKAERKEVLQVTGFMVVFIIVLGLPFYFDWYPGLHHLF